MESLPSYVWERCWMHLDSDNAEDGPSELRSDVVHACLLSAGFVNNQVFSMFREWPWQLFVGD